MPDKKRVTLALACEYLKFDFITAIEFADFGLFPVYRKGKTVLIAVDDFTLLKKVVSFHSVLGVNKEGIDIILELSERLIQLESQLAAPHNNYLA